MSKWQRVGLGIVVFAAWATIMVVSLAANAKFAWGLGSSEFERWVLVAASGASDVFKAVAPVAFLWMCSKRNWAGAVAAFLVGAVTTIFSLVAATGFMAGERYHAYYAAKAAHEATVATRKEIEATATNRAWLPTHKPLSVLEAELAMHKSSPAFAASAGCTRQKGPAHFEVCKLIGETNVAIAAAKEAAKADAKIAERRGELMTKGRDYDDPLYDVLNRWTGIGHDKLLIIVIALGVLLIELGSGLGLTFALGLLAPDTSKLGRVLSIVRPSEKVIEPQPEATPVARVAGLADPRPLQDPVVVRAESGGLRAKMRTASVDPPRKRA